MPRPLLSFRRVAYADHARSSADELVGPEDAGRVGVEATRLANLQAIQVAFDQLARHGEDLANDPARAADYAAPFPLHARQTMEHVRRHRDVLRVAADAADSMIDVMTAQINSLEAAMSKKRDDDSPKLTTDGSPHPLQEGGYDPDADPQLPSNISDVEALKEGKTTHDQNEAIAKGQPETEPVDEPDEDEDEPDDSKPVAPSTIRSKSEAKRQSGGNPKK